MEGRRDAYQESVGVFVLAVRARVDGAGAKAEALPELHEPEVERDEMNETETRTYQWLRKRGYAAREIEYQPNQSPDFLTADGLGFEAKLPTRDHGVYFETNQLRDLIGTTVLIWDDDDCTVVPFDALTIPGNFARYRLRVRHPDTIHKSIDIPRALHRAVMIRAAEDGKTFSDVVREALEAYAGAK